MSTSIEVGICKAFPTYMPQKKNGVLSRWFVARLLRGTSNKAHTAVRGCLFFMQGAWDGC